MIDRTLVAIVSLALAARLAFLVDGARDPFVSLRTVDEVSHTELAHRFASGDVLFGSETLWFPPAYPVFLGLVETAFGSALPVVPLMQHAIGIVTAVLAVLTGRRLGSPFAGAIAGGLLAVLPTLVHAESRLHYTAFLVAASAAFLFTFANVGRAPAGRRSGLAGLWLGIAGLFRANVLAFAPFGALITARRAGWGAATRLALGVLVTLLPVTLRNGLVAGAWTPLTSNGGMILATAFAKDAAGGRALERTPRDFGPHGEFHREAEQALGRALTLAEASRFHAARTFEQIRTSPAWSVQLTARKLRILANAEEIDDHPGFAIARTRTAALGWLPAPWAWVAFPAAWGAWVALLGRDPVAREFRMPLGFLLVSAATLLVFFVTSRYRLPLVAPAALLAGLGMDRCVRAIRRKDARVLLACLGIAAAGIVPVLGDPGVRADPAMNWASISGALSDRGDHEDALHAADEAIRRSPSLAGAWQNRAVALTGLGRSSEALRATEEALRFDPELAPAWNTQGALLAASGDIEGALERFERAEALAPEDPDVLSNLARAHGALGDLAPAIAIGKRAIAAGASDLERDVASWEAERRE